MSSSPVTRLRRKRTASLALITDRSTGLEPASLPQTPGAGSERNEYDPAEGLPHSTKKTTGAIQAFSQMRAIRIADGRTDKSLNLQQNSNREAYLAQRVGAEQVVPCKSCCREHGPWKDCVVVAGFLTGSCANCHFNSEGRRCSLRSSQPALSAPSSPIFPRRPSRRASRNSVARSDTASSDGDVLPLSCYFSQMVDSAHILSPAARAARRADIYLELSALSAADAADLATTAT